MLPGDLPRTGQIPVYEKLCRVRMGRPVYQRDDAAAATANGAAFFKLIRRQVIHRQPLLHRFVDLAAKMTKREFPSREPVGPLPPVAEQCDLGLSVKPP